MIRLPDNSRQSSVLAAQLRAEGIAVAFSSPYHPQTADVDERKRRRKSGGAVE